VGFENSPDFSLILLQFLIVASLFMKQINTAPDRTFVELNSVYSLVEVQERVTKRKSD
jgi:hypothetical protein